jgi:Zn-dependent alcohol dehydrogenase
VYGNADPTRDFPEMIRLHRAGALDLEMLVSNRIALDDLEEAFRAMDAGEVARSVVIY